MECDRGETGYVKERGGSPDLESLSVTTPESTVRGAYFPPRTARSTNRSSRCGAKSRDTCRRGSFAVVPGTSSIRGRTSPAAAARSSSSAPDRGRGLRQRASVDLLPPQRLIPAAGREIESGHRQARSRGSDLHDADPGEPLALPGPPDRWHAQQHGTHPADPRPGVGEPPSIDGLKDRHNAPQVRRPS